MRFILFVTLVVCLAFAFCAPPPEPEPEATTQEPTNTEAHMQTIRENIKQWDDAINAGDVEGLVSLYATDAVRMEPDQPAWVGKPAIMRGFEGWFAQDMFP